MKSSSNNHNSNKCCAKRDECEKSLNHLNRIDGQLKTLRKYIEKSKSCEEIAMLSTSIAKSFDTLRLRTMRNFFVNEILAGEKVSKKSQEKINMMLKLYKK